MQEIYFQYDANGNIVSVFGNPQPQIPDLVAIPIDDTRYKAWFDALPEWQQVGWPIPAQ
jgi:hypothetical protein